MSNNLYKAQYNGYIFKISSIKNINFVADSSNSIKGASRTFFLSYDSLGEPSCAKVWYTVGVNASQATTYGSTAAYCSSAYPGVNYAGVYNTLNGTLSFNFVMSVSGFANIHFLIKNDLESLTTTTNATISSLSCQRPTLDIINRAADFLNPMVIAKSKMFSLVATTTLSCDSTLQNTKQWSLYQINPVTGVVLKKMSLANVLSAFSAEIFIPSKYLSYGTYMFLYQVNMNGDAGPFVETVNTFVRIVPTGMAIFPFSGGIKEITIATGQSIDLDPGKYSYDFDGIFTGTQLTYRFFCRIVANVLPQDFPSDSYNNFLDLKQFFTSNFFLKQLFQHNR